MTIRIRPQRPNGSERPTRSMMDMRAAISTWAAGPATWRFIAVKKFLSRAKELDALRFRAPDTMNGIISELCKKYNNTHLWIQRPLLKASPITDHRR